MNFVVVPIVNNTGRNYAKISSPSLVDDMKSLSLGSTTNGPTSVVQTVSNIK